MSQLTPPFKGKASLTISELCRSIALESSLSKVHTTILRKRLHDFRMTQNLIPLNRLNFILGKSTLMAVQKMKLTINCCWEDKEPMYVCFIDFRQAFDSIIRNSFLQKPGTISIFYFFS